MAAGEGRQVIRQSHAAREPRTTGTNARRRRAPHRPNCDRDRGRPKVETGTGEIGRQVLAQMPKADETVTHRCSYSHPSGRFAISRCSTSGDIRMRPSHRLVELDAEPGRGRRNDVAVLPTNRLLQDLGMEAAPLLNAFQDQKVGRAGRDLNVGRADHGPAIQMRSDLRVMHFRERRHLLGLEQAADASRDSSAGYWRRPRRVRGQTRIGGQPFAGGDRNAGAARDHAPFARASPAAPVPRTRADRILQVLGEPHGARRS